MPLTFVHALLASAVARKGVIDFVPHPIFIKDADGRFVLVNQSMCKLMGRDSDTLLGKTDYDFVPREQADIFRAWDQLVLETGEPDENEELLTDSEGGARDIVTRRHRVSLPSGARFIVGCITDMTELREAARRATDKGNHVSLAEIRNRMLFQRALEEARAAAMQLVLVWFDPRGHLAEATFGR